MAGKGRAAGAVGCQWERRQRSRRYHNGRQYISVPHQIGHPEYQLVGVAQQQAKDRRSNIESATYGGEQRKQGEVGGEVGSRESRERLGEQGDGERRREKQ